MRTLLRTLLLALLVLPVHGTSQAPPVQPPGVCLSGAEMDLYLQINQYRSEEGLAPVPLSSSLSYVAQAHAKDLADNHPYNKRCNLHSWSNRGPWSPCCYTEDHRKAACMWSKPSELTPYKDPGYEIAYWTDEPLGDQEFARKALAAWKKSYDHHIVIVNSGKWKNHTWKAMGVGICKGYATVWFGEAEDPAGIPGTCAPQASQK
jgi:hypothetical protein